MFNLEGWMVNMEMVMEEECLLMVVEGLCLWVVDATSSQYEKTCIAFHLLDRTQLFGCGCNKGKCHHELQVSSMGRGYRLVD
jgi:hypothetical protein